MFNTLQLLIQNPQNYIEYTEGLNKLMEPINKQIPNRAPAAICVGSGGTGPGLGHLLFVGWRARSSC